MKIRNIFERIISYGRRHGIKGALRHGCKKAIYYIESKRDHGNYIYKRWMRHHEPSEEELKEQRNATFSLNPKFSILLLSHHAPKPGLQPLVQSLQAQTYSNWELCDAYSNAQGDYVVMADGADSLSVDALYELAMAIEKESDIDVLYSDDDRIDGDVRVQPHFKSDFNIDLLRSTNYIGRFLVVKKSLADEVGEQRLEFKEARGYDYIFRCVEKAQKVYHIPKILYHRGYDENSTHIKENERLVIEAHLNRCGINATVIYNERYGVYHTSIGVMGNPMVTIIIPNKDHIEDLNKCLTSIYEKTTYRNYEIIIVENNSSKQETFTYYKELEKQYENINVIVWGNDFNYAAINNYAVTHAKGEYVLFLNNDTEVISGNWLEEMLGYCQREDVGVVGARLYYPDDTIQHAGVIIGFGGVAGHTFLGQGRYESGYFARAMCTQNYSAVTAACMMTPKKLFENLNGFLEDFRIAFNDIDYCLRVRNEGKLVVYNSQAELYHYESKSRGLEGTREKAERFKSEIKLFQNKWHTALEKSDPFYNPNLALDRSDFALKK